MMTIRDLIEELSKLPLWMQERPVYLEILDGNYGSDNSLIIEAEDSGVTLKQSSAAAVGYPLSAKEEDD